MIGSKSGSQVPRINPTVSLRFVPLLFVRQLVSLLVKKDITTGEPINKKVQMACNVVLPNKETKLCVATINNVDKTAPKYPLYLGSHYINNCDDVAKIYDNKAKQMSRLEKTGS